jgi:hypothetical protein
MEADMGKVKPTRFHCLPIFCVERGHEAVHRFAGSGYSRGNFLLGVHRKLPSTNLVINQSCALAIAMARLVGKTSLPGLTDPAPTPLDVIDVAEQLLGDRRDHYRERTIRMGQTGVAQSA